MDIAAVHVEHSLFEFFFSSRRRHTRSLCDWSSDVCSADLAAVGGARRQPHEVAKAALLLQERERRADAHRSEERRVGKECRYAWPPPSYNTKYKTTIAFGTVDMSTNHEMCSLSYPAVRNYT